LRERPASICRPEGRGDGRSPGTPVQRPPGWVAGIRAASSRERPARRFQLRRRQRSEPRAAYDPTLA